MSTAEIQRALRRIDQVMTTFVTVDAWTRENDRMKERIADGDKDCRERTEGVRRASAERFEQLESRGQVTWGRVVAVLTLVLSLLGFAWAVYSTSKGVK